MGAFYPKMEYLGPDFLRLLLGDPRMWCTSWDAVSNPLCTSESKDNLKLSNILKPILFLDTLYN